MTIRNSINIQVRNKFFKNSLLSILVVPSSSTNNTHFNLVEFINLLIFNITNASVSFTIQIQKKYKYRFS